ncbi:hypothetical protein [Erwinia sp. JUb26]|uniref:hypothetical protein n=1 Tax=Erwinia sp. JUb26 TaxID=2485126 RepID=UPI000F49138B|nr:hypothetical protein [Erwinia sp. JUb26]ROR13165.1 hypothetical protein EC836_10265 [Erwinia sp. JUb26]
MACGAVILGIIGWAHKEEHRVAAAAGILGMATIAFQPAMTVFALIILFALITIYLQDIIEFVTGLLG